MLKASALLEKAAELRDMAQRALRLAAGLLDADRLRLTQYGEDLRTQADELERQAAAGTEPRSAEPSRDTTLDKQKPKKGRGASNDPEPQA
jgi:hypothetical protein